MEFFQNLRTQIAELWRQADRPRQVMIVAVGALTVALAIGVGFWSSRPQYIPLASDLAPATAAELVSRLDSAGIPHQLSFSGSSVLVPKSQWNEARLLAGDVVEPVNPADVGFEESLFSDPSLNHQRMLHRRESALAASISRLDPVTSATVHISQPEPTPFVREQADTKASVILQLRPGHPLSAEQASGIVSMVAHGVEGLNPDNVTVLDSQGRILSGGGTTANSEISAQFDHQRRVEAELAAKAEQMLRNMLGPGRAVVRVTAELDFTQSERTETTYNPELKVKTSERIKSTSRQATGSGGAAGAGANLNSANLLKDPVLEKEEETETEYENPQIVDIVREAGGVIQRLTVAVVTDLSSDNDTAGAATKEQVETLVKQAVGFDANRSDEIEVLIAPLAGAVPVDDGLAVDNRSFYMDLARNGSLGLGAILAFVFGLITLRKMKPVTVTENHSLSSDSARKLADVIRTAEQDPEAVARIISAWAGPEDSGGSQSAPRREAA